MFVKKSGAQREFNDFEKNLRRDELLRSLLVLFSATESNLYQVASEDREKAKSDDFVRREYNKHMLNCNLDKHGLETQIKNLKYELDSLRNKCLDGVKLSKLYKEANALKQERIEWEAKKKQDQQLGEAQELEDAAMRITCPCSNQRNKWARVRRKELEALQNRSELVSLLEDFFGVPEYQVFLAAEALSKKLEKAQRKLQELFRASNE